MGSMPTVNTAENDLEHLRSNAYVKAGAIEDEQVRAAFGKVSELESRLENARLRLEA